MCHQLSPFFSNMIIRMTEQRQRERNGKCHAWKQMETMAIRWFFFVLATEIWCRYFGISLDFDANILTHNWCVSRGTYQLHIFKKEFICLLLEYVCFHPLLLGLSIHFFFFFTSAYSHLFTSAWSYLDIFIHLCESICLMTSLGFLLSFCLRLSFQKLRKMHKT